jgi:mannitol/fructose-specific phosphotransferase system IIA component (Ntr-type)
MEYRMRLTEILQPDCIKVPLVATAKQAAIFELIDLVADRFKLPSGQELRDAVWQRETTRTTGIGHGIAIPHGRTSGLSRLCMAIGITSVPIDFNAIDSRPVNLIILLASPPDQANQHIQALARISRLLSDDKFRNTLKAAPTADSVYQLIVSSESGTP